MEEPELTHDDLVLREISGEAKARSFQARDAFVSAQDLLFAEDQDFTIGELGNGLMLYLAAFLLMNKDTMTPEIWDRASQHWQIHLNNVFTRVNEPGAS